MGPFDFPTEIDDRSAYRRAVALLGEKGIVLPTFAQLANPATLPEALRTDIKATGPDAADQRADRHPGQRHPYRPLPALARENLIQKQPMHMNVGKSYFV